MIGSIGRWGAGRCRAVRSPEAWTFLILTLSYGAFWHGRDWNSASRLMLTYAVADRGTPGIDGLEDQTHDRALVDGRYYSDKFPGYSLLALPWYLLAKWWSGIEGHPLNARGFAYWWPDYWATWGASGLISALTGSLVVAGARRMGCGPRGALACGLGYGLGTPAYVYATLSYGHQAAAGFAFASWFLLTGRRLTVAGAFSSGFCAAMASVVELQSAPVSAILGLGLLGRVIWGDAGARGFWGFSAGASIPTLILLGYNAWAFGSPLDSGYFHLETPMFAAVHSEENPLGLRGWNGEAALGLLWGERRGILFYAPIAWMGLPGLLLASGARGTRWAGLSAVLIVLAVYLVNVSYPAWDGGWSTGPRLLVPALPFVAVGAGALAGRLGGWGTGGVAALGIAGFVLATLFQGVGGRVPQYLDSPLREGVLPLWRGEALPVWATEGRFARTAVDWAFPGWVESLGAGEGWLKFAPIAGIQCLLAVLAWLATGSGGVPEKKSGKSFGKSGRTASS